MRMITRPSRASSLADLGSFDSGVVPGLPELAATSATTGQIFPTCGVKTTQLLTISSDPSSTLKDYRVSTRNDVALTVVLCSAPDSDQNATAVLKPTSSAYGTRNPTRRESSRYASARKNSNAKTRTCTSSYASSTCDRTRKPGRSLGDFECRVMRWRSLTPCGLPICFYRDDKWARALTRSTPS